MRTRWAITVVMLAMAGLLAGAALATSQSDQLDRCLVESGGAPLMVVFTP